MSISCWKKQTIPGRTVAQIKAARPKCAALYRKYRLKNWILDDESYFTLSHSSINGWEATNLVQLKRRILKCLREFDVGRIQALMGDVIGRVDYVRRYDVIEKR